MYPAATDSWQRARLGPAWLLASAIALLAVTIQSLVIPLDADVSWLITVCEAVLSGKRLYRDIVEVNPPASVWLYLPWVALAKLLGVRAEAVVAGATIGAALLSLRATLKLSARLPHPPNPMVVAAAIGFVTLLLPGGLFAQREHIALIIALPVLAAVALLSDRGRLPIKIALLAGIGAGLMIEIKPHFALALLLPALWGSRRLRSPAPLLLPAAAAVVVVALYAAAVLLFEPEFIALLPMLAATYLPMSAPWWQFFLSSLLIVPLALAIAAKLLNARSGNALASMWLLGGLGFALAGLLQWKNYANHALPGVALCLAGVLLLLLGGHGERSRRLTVGIGVAAMSAALLLQTGGIQPQAGLAEAIRRVAPASPGVMTLGTELVTGHPAVRHAGGHWVGSRASLFTAAAARFAGLDHPGVRRWYDEDLALFATDVRRERPAIVLVEDENRSWLLREPVVRAVMRDYAPAARAGGIEVWRRR